MFRSLRSLIFAGALLAGGAAHAQLGHEIAARHAARAGDKLAALTALRAEGKTFINGEVVPFTLIARRPNQLRVESFTPQRRVIQAYDGTNPPWISHSETNAGRAQAMTDAEARDFIGNADFDGPLVDFARKGFSVDYAGEDKIDGRRAFKLLLMNQSDNIFFLWVDAENYEVIKRTVYRVFDEKRVTVDTFFKDFRPVAGTLQPFRVETNANGRQLYVMIIDRMEANPADLGDDIFRRPDADAGVKPLE